MGQNANSILLYDGLCGFCSKIARVMCKNTEISFVSLQSETGQKLLSRFLLGKTSVNTIVYVSHDRIYFKSTAFFIFLKDKGGFWRFFYIFIVLPKPIRDFFYDVIARNRYRIFGKHASCKLNV
jgi:predicted DCC family thiol-disulfide oxidoreductase YuxK